VNDIQPGMRIGKLTVIGHATGRRRDEWICRCECGVVVRKRTQAVNHAIVVGAGSCKKCANVAARGW